MIVVVHYIVRWLPYHSFLGFSCWSLYITWCCIEYRMRTNCMSLNVDHAFQDLVDCVTIIPCRWRHILSCLRDALTINWTICLLWPQSPHRCLITKSGCVEKNKYCYMHDSAFFLPFLGSETETESGKMNVIVLLVIHGGTKYFWKFLFCIFSEFTIV